MKKNRFLLFVALAFSFVSCSLILDPSCISDIEDDYISTLSFRCHVTNNSGNDVLVYVTWDSILPLQYLDNWWQAYIKNDSCEWVGTWRTVPSKVNLKDSPDYYSFSLFVFDTDTFNLYDWCEIRNRNLVKCRYDVYGANRRDSITITNIGIK